MANIGPAVSTRARAALGDISNRGLAGGAAAGKAGGKVGVKPSVYDAEKMQVEVPSSRLQAESKLDGFKLHDGTKSYGKEQVDKVDAVDASNPQYIVPYLQDIHRHYREAEGLKHASPSYMSKQTDINAKMRAILIDWLVEVHLKFKLMPETLYLTVNLIDRYLEKEQIMRNKLQLVGVTAMFIASKYEEIYAPECRDFVYISDKAYTRDEILRMEGLMLARLNFQLTAPNAFVFVKRFAKVAGIATTPRSTTELLANYLVELTLQDYKMLKYLPSTICASAIYLALKTKGKTPWTPELEKHSTYKEADLQACVRDIHELHKNASTHSLQAVRKKYAQEKHGNVSSIAPAHLGW
jgi:cyclin B